MAAPLILSHKLHRPAVPAIHVRRDALLQALRAGLAPGIKLTVVLAGPGYGKTTLVVDYVAWSGLPCAWYMLDEADADPTSLLAHLVAALQRIFPGVGQRSLELAQSAGLTPASVQNVVGLLAEALAEPSDKPWILVLDDVHAARGIPLVEQALRYLVQFFPETAQLIASGRSAPALKLPRLRARQQVVELGPDSLRLSAREAAKLFQATDRPDAGADGLWMRTEGWIAGLILLLRGTSGGARDPVPPTAAAQERLLFSYLAEEAFQDLPTELRAFLLATAPLPEFDLEVCEQALQLPVAQAMIDRLQQEQLFLTALEGEKYRYHPLFREFLLARRRREGNRAELQAEYCRLAAWYQQRQPEQAIAFWIQAEDYQAAEREFCQHVRQLLDARRLDTIAALLDLFPRPIREQSAWLQLYAGYLELRRQNADRSLARLQRAHELAHQSGDDHALGMALVCQAMAWSTRDLDRARELAEAALAKLPAHELVGRAIALSRIGNSLVISDSRNIRQGMAYLQQSLATYQAAGNAYGESVALMLLGNVQVLLGEFERAVVYFRQAIDRAHEVDQITPPSAYSNLGVALLELGRVAEARSAFEEALSRAQLLADTHTEAWIYHGLGLLNMAEGSWGSADRALAQSLEMARQHGDHLLAAEVAQDRAEMALQRQRPAEARTLLASAVAERPQFGSGFRLMQGRVELANGDGLAAEVHLQAAYQQYQHMKSSYYQAYCLFVLARVAQAKGDAAGAKQQFTAALQLAERHNHRYLIERETAQFQAAHLQLMVAAEPPTEVAALRIRCFGSFEVQVEGKPVMQRTWRGVKLPLILAYLLHNRKGLSRERLAELFYADEDVTPTAIYALISRLRRALEPQLKDSSASRFIHFLDGRYAFNFGVRYRLDTEEFSYLLASARAAGTAREEAERMRREALGLYRGAFLAPFSGDAWVEEEAERYRRLALRAGDELTRLVLAREDYDDALAIADQLLGIDACHEPAHQAKMSALAGRGERGQALRHFGVLQRRLAREFGVEPAAETVALHRRIAQQR